MMRACVYVCVCVCVCPSLTSLFVSSTVLHLFPLSLSISFFRVLYKGGVGWMIQHAYAAVRVTLAETAQEREERIRCSSLFVSPLLRVPLLLSPRIALSFFAHFLDLPLHFVSHCARRCVSRLRFFSFRVLSAYCVHCWCCLFFFFPSLLHFHSRFRFSSLTDASTRYVLVIAIKKESEG